MYGDIFLLKLHISDMYQSLTIEILGEPGPVTLLSQLQLLMYKINVFFRYLSFVETHKRSKETTSLNTSCVGIVVFFSSKEAQL